MGSVLETDKKKSIILNLWTINMVMDYLDRVFQDMMLVLKARMADSQAPSSPVMNPCDLDFFVFLGWGLPEGVVEKAPPCQPLGPQGDDH
jgi:hypothetical protein